MQFFQLPREICDLIHKHTFRYVSIDVGILELLHHDVGRRKHCLYYDQPAPIMDHALALLCVNHQVAAEAAFILYSKSTFTGCPCGKLYQECYIADKFPGAIILHAMTFYLKRFFCCRVWKGWNQSLPNTKNKSFWRWRKL